MGDDFFHSAMSSYSSGDYAKAKDELDRLIVDYQGTPHELVARYMRARGFEKGAFEGGVDLLRAYEDYYVVRWLSESFEYFSDGALGCARVLFKINKFSNKEDIVGFCVESIERGADVRAMMLLGLVRESVFMEVKEARRLYLKAYFKGMPWGLRYYARSMVGEGRYVVGWLAHALTYVTSPFVAVVHGIRKPFE